MKSGLEIVPVSRMDEVLSHALTRMPERIEWEEPATAPAAAPSDDEAASATAH